MTIDTQEFYQQMYNNQLVLLNQQLGSVLEKTVTVHNNVTGDKYTVEDRVGEASSIKNPAAKSATLYSETPKTRRSVASDRFYSAELLDVHEMVKVVNSPKSVIIEAQVAKLGRDKDLQIIDALFGTAFGGEKGQTNIAWDTGNIIPVATGASSATGLNAAKIKAAKKGLKQKNMIMPGDEVWMAITAQQEDDLLNDIELINNDYSGAGVVRDAEGNLKRYLGVNFVITELLKTNDSSQRMCPIYTKKSMHLAKWYDIKGRVTMNIPERLHSTQIFADCITGATRTREDGVFQIPCVE